MMSVHGANPIFFNKKKYRLDVQKTCYPHPLCPITSDFCHQLLTPEATVHVEDEVLDIDEPPATELKKNVAKLKWKRKSKFVKA